jgi:hypothetical protein
MRPLAHATLAGGLLLLATGVTGSRAQNQVTLAPAKDNTLYFDATGSLSDGGGQFLFAGETATAKARRGLLAFDLTGIPAGSTIVSANLTLHMSRTIAGPEDVALYRATSNWGEGTSVALGDEGGGAPATTGDATWLHTFYNTSFWTTQGGDFAASASATASVDTVGFYTWGPTVALVADVQGWLDNPAANFGWVVLGNEHVSGSTKRFDSRQNLDPAVRPVLAISYTAPVAVNDTPPGGLLLAPNAPNPFNPRTVVTWRLPSESRMSLAIYDARGRRVVTLVSGTQPAGDGSATWDGNDEAGRPAASGSYLCRLEATGADGVAVQRRTRIMTLVR